MKNTLNTPAQVFAEYLTAVEAYEVGGPQLQARWIQGREDAGNARRDGAQAAALLVGAACTIFTAVVLVFC